MQSYPPTDLVVTDFTIPGSGSSGQSVDVTYSVRNNEQGETLSSRWYDNVYFSSDTELDAGDILLEEITHDGSVAYNEIYSASIRVNLPDGVSGDNYLIIKTDGNNRVSESSEENNTSYSPISVELTPPPDLQITAYEIPSQGVAGQPLDLTWTVQNNGTGTTDIETWYDGVFLSLDNVLDRSDTRLKTIPHSGLLGPGNSYSAGAEVELPIFASGSYFLLIKADSGKNVYEHGAESNNLASGTVSITIPPPSDLIVTDITVPASAIPGDMITVSWTVENIGENAAVGIMRDGVYLSEDGTWDIDDPLLGYIDYEINISAGSSRTMRRSMRLARAARSDGQGAISEMMPGILPGKYYAIVRTDLRNNIYENDDSNNMAYSSGQTDVDFRTLQLGASDSGTLTQNQSYYYAVDAPADATLLVSFDSDSTTAFNELFVSYGQVPNSRQFEFGYDTPLGSDQSIVIPQTQEGRYYIMVNGSSVPGDSQSFNIKVSLLEFDLFEIDIDEGGQGGPATIKLEGARFTQNMQVWLQNGGEKYESSRVYFQDSSVVYATFDLTDMPLGNYDVVIGDTVDDIQDNDYAVLENCFDVAMPRSIPFEMHINAPSATRVGQNFAYRIEYANPSNNDMVSPFLLLGSDTYFERYLPAYSELTGDAHKIRAVSSDGPAYILRPGSLGAVSIKANSPDISGEFILGAISINAEAPRWATQDLFIFKNIRINSQGKEVDLIDKIISKVSSQPKSGISFPDGAKFIPTSAIDGRALDINNYLLKNTEVIPGILEYKGNYFFSVFTSSDINLEKETVGISDSLDVDFSTIFPEDIKIGDIGSMDYTIFQFLPTEDYMAEYGLNALSVAQHRADVGSTYSLTNENYTKAVFYNHPFIVGEGSRNLRTQAKLVYEYEMRDDGRTYEVIENNEKGGSQDPIPSSKVPSEDKVQQNCVAFVCINGPLIQGPLIEGPLIEFNIELNIDEVSISDLIGVGTAASSVYKTFNILKNLIPIDPNDITGPEGYGENQWISSSQNMFYTIRFENDPEFATAPAQVVTIRQTLDSDLDPRTFRLGSFGFGEHVFNVPENTSYHSDRLDLTDSLGIYVDINAGIDINTNEVFWILRSIDPSTGQAPTDPFAGFLPVNDPETHVGEGFVNYTIHPKETAATGDVIDAQARIVFDVNEPIDTPPIFNTIDADLPSSKLENSAQTENRTTFTLNWTAQDTEGGSGLQGVTLYMATDDQPYAVYEENLTEISLTVSLSPEHDYRFFTIAKDNAGNTEPMKTQAELTISLKSEPSVPPTADAGQDQHVPEKVLITLDASASSQTDGEIVSYQWTQTAGTPVTLSDSAAVSPSFTTPDVNSNEEYLIFQLTVTNDQGLQSTDQCVVFILDAEYTDTDEDGMSDEWEIKYFGTLDKGGFGDEDNDGIPNHMEYMMGTDPLADTNGDINYDRNIDLADAVLALQIVAGIDTALVVNELATGLWYDFRDVNGDEKIGIEEALYILRKLGNLNPDF